MAPAPAPPSRGGGFSFRNPGGKELLITGGVVLGAALLYFWWKGRNTSPAAAAPADTSAGPSTPTGLSTGALLAWIRDHQSSTTTTKPAPESKAQEAAEEKHEPKGT